MAGQARPVLAARTTCSASALQARRCEGGVGRLGGPTSGREGGLLWRAEQSVQRWRKRSPLPVADGGTSVDRGPLRSGDSGQAVGEIRDLVNQRMAHRGFGLARVLLRRGLRPGGRGLRGGCSVRLHDLRDSRIAKSKRAHTQEKVERENRDEAADHGGWSISRQALSTDGPMRMPLRTRKKKAH